MRKYYIFTESDGIELEFNNSLVRFAGQWISRDSLIRQLKQLLNYLEKYNGN